MSTKHTPGPWQTRGTDIHKSPLAKENYLGSMNGSGLPTAIDMANAARIVECVNACEGVEDPSQLKNSHREYLLTRGLLRDSEQFNKQLQDQLRQIESLCSNYNAEFGPALESFWSKFNAIIGVNAGGGGNG